MVSGGEVASQAVLHGTFQSSTMAQAWARQWAPGTRRWAEHLMTHRLGPPSSQSDPSHEVCTTAVLRLKQGRLVIVQCVCSMPQQQAVASIQLSDPLPMC